MTDFVRLVTSDIHNKVDRVNMRRVCLFDAAESLHKTEYRSIEDCRH